MNELAPLTPKQLEIFNFIRKYIEEHGYPPAIRDIGRAFDIVSPNGVMCHLRALQKKGHIHRDEKTDTQGGKARAITIPGVSAGGFSLPMLGLVAAGKALEATEQNERLDMKDLFGGDNLYMLKVRGTSMIESQIADGDYVVIRKQEQADNGEKVVAMVDKSMTLKKFYRKRDHIRLEPCNSTMDPIVVDPSKENVQILGVLVGVIRKC
ncbi:transcriptional repressor LexA [Fimbriiglobus ruber]|uniref:LexA repressor n=1 Tax=Fimbriiglobus ruber TaxID=1908690 RepID=A0A225DQM8_9BACT|nr:transcriptional repressor LexA [Fimbriiglobus ruber]OWK43601.1 LexA repressor [Fimbriiglobus ruber]